MKLSNYDFTTHQPYLEKNTSYREYLLNSNELLFGNVWAAYQVDNFDKKKNIAFPDICMDLMVFYTPDKVHSYLVSGTESCRSMDNDFSFIKETQTIFGVKFYPGKINNFCDETLRDSGAMAIEAAYGLRKGKDTIKRIENAESFEERWSIIKNYLCKCLCDDRTDPLVVYATNSIIENRGNVRICDMEKKTGYTNRYLRKRFSESVGISLKKFTEITKMQWTYELYQKNKRMKMTDLAVESGYYDQSHMNNTFKSLTGMLPKDALNLYIA
jgi:AraC-like DNA-binding protein